MAEQESSRKYHALTSAQRRKIAIIVSLVILAALPPFTLFYYKFSVHRPSQTSDEITYEVKKGARVSDISNDLYKLGTLNSQFLFNFYVYLNKIDRNIQAGVYVIPAGTSIVKLADMFQYGVNDTKITFIEGWRVEEFAREASQKLSNVDYKEFVRIAKKHEGYLFPDTYMFKSEVREEELIDQVIKNFEGKTKEILTKENLSKAGLTKEEAMIFASIVEREVYQEEDRRVVAGILVKRWKEDMPLGADATTQYVVAVDKYCVPEFCRASGITCKLDPSVESCLRELSKDQALQIDWWPRDLMIYDLDYEDPYNTRKNVGLPPGPICNPGLDALEAVLDHKTTDYYYYINDLSGNTHFAITLAEHQNNILKYLRN